MGAFIPVGLGATAAARLKATAITAGGAQCNGCNYPPLAPADAAHEVGAFSRYRA
jgi:hypothetical protein